MIDISGLVEGILRHEDNIKVRSCKQRNLEEEIAIKRRISLNDITTVSFPVGAKVAPFSLLNIIEKRLHVVDGIVLVAWLPVRAGEPL